MIFSLLLFFLTACSHSLRPLYDQERAESLKTITSAPDKDWAPDIRLSIAYRALSNLTQQLLEQKISKGNLPVDIFGQKLNVRLLSDIKSLNLSAGKDNVIKFLITLDGSVELKHSLLNLSNPFSAKLNGTLEIDVDKNKLQIKANHIEDIQITTKNIPQLKINTVIKDWLNNNLSSLPSQEIMTLELSNLSSRAIRFTGNRHSLDIEALSFFPQTSPLPPQKKHPRGDWEMRISNSALSQIIRQQTFALPPVKNHHIDISQIAIEGKVLKSKLRLWKLDGKGDWWRDYEIEAKITTEDKEILLTNPKAKQLAKSPGAGLADPISLFGEKVILNEITKQIKYKLPKEKSASISDNQLLLNITGIMGQQEHISMFGTIDSAKEKKKPRRRRRNK